MELGVTKAELEHAESDIIDTTLGTVFSFTFVFVLDEYLYWLGVYHARISGLVDLCLYDL